MSQETQQNLSDVSKVNPDKRLKKLKDKGGLAVVLIICLFIIGFMFSAHKTKADNTIVKASPHQESSDTLEKNLAFIEQMKQESALKEQKQIAFKEHAVKPPKLRKTKTQRISKEMKLRMNAPSTLVNNERAVSTSTVSMASGHQGADSQGMFVGNNANTQFMNQQGDIATVSARKIPRPDLTVPAGEMIPATLGVAMNSELPGMILAVTERNIYSLTGENILIPRGSRLVGQYSSGIIQGQSRFLVMWNRVQLPNGVIVSINSPGADDLGRSGFEADSINRHFLARFGESSLLSIIGAFAANQGVDSNTQYNSAAEYRAALAASFNQTAQQTFARDSQIKPSLDKFQGAAISVFVAKDLDFSAVGKQTPRSVDYSRGGMWK